MTRWYRARFHAHTFHYRMPETVAIQSVNPLVPSPSTVKLALLAAWLDRGRVAEAERLAAALHRLEVRVRPPVAAVVFRALMRYVRPPASAPRTPEDLDSGTASHYKISPHYRELALWSEPLEVWVGAPPEVADLVAEGLPRIRYLGAKDSQVTCLVCEEQPGPPPSDTYRVFNTVEPEPEPGQVSKPPDGGLLPSGADPAEAAGDGMLGQTGLKGSAAPGVVIQLAEVVRPLQAKTAIPGSRPRGSFVVKPYVLPGRLVVRGGTRQYFRG